MVELNKEGVKKQLIGMSSIIILYVVSGAEPNGSLNLPLIGLKLTNIFFLNLFIIFYWTLTFFRFKQVNEIVMSKDYSKWFNESGNPDFYKIVSPILKKYRLVGISSFQGIRLSNISFVLDINTSKATEKQIEQLSGRFEEGAIEIQCDNITAGLYRTTVNLNNFSDGRKIKNKLIRSAVYNCPDIMNKKLPNAYAYVALSGIIIKVVFSYWGDSIFFAIS